MKSRFRFSSDVADIDRALVHRWLSEEAYWAAGRTREKQDAAIDASRNYGVFDAQTGAQLAYARVVTDGVTFAWLCDVFVSEQARGEGIGKELIAGVVADIEPMGLRRAMLATSDAHQLYAKYGFEAVSEPGRFMVRLPR